MFKRLKHSASFYNNHILDQYAARSTQRVTLRQLIVFGRNLSHDKLLKSANYVRNELPVRLAHRIRDFQNLPFIVGTNPHIELVYNLYWEAFELFRSVPTITNLDDNHAFCEQIEQMLNKHLVAIPQLAMGIAEASSFMDPLQVDRFMNEMLRSRIGRRLLAEQHLSLTEGFMDSEGFKVQGMVGIVDYECDAVQLVQKCVNRIQSEFSSIFGVDGLEFKCDGQMKTRFTYVPDHLEYILYELLKNSAYHTIEKSNPSFNNINDNSKFEEIRVTIAQSDDMVMIRVSDQANGIPKEIFNQLWSFSHISKQKLSNFNQLTHVAARVSEKIPLNLQLGLGLSMSKSYAKYLGGNIDIHSIHGYGTDVYLKLSTANQEESLDF